MLLEILDRLGKKLEFYFSKSWFSNANHCISMVAHYLNQACIFIIRLSEATIMVNSSLKCVIYIMIKSKCRRDIICWIVSDQLFKFVFIKEIPTEYQNKKYQHVEMFLVNASFFKTSFFLIEMVENLTLKDIDMASFVQMILRFCGPKH